MTTHTSRSQTRGTANSATQLDEDMARAEGEGMVAERELHCEPQRGLLARLFARATVVVTQLRKHLPKPLGAR